MTIHAGCTMRLSVIPYYDRWCLGTLRHFLSHRWGETLGKPYLRRPDKQSQIVFGEIGFGIVNDITRKGARRSLVIKKSSFTTLCMCIGVCPISDRSHPGNQTSTSLSTTIPREKRLEGAYNTCQHLSYKGVMAYRIVYSAWIAPENSLQ